MWVEIFPDYKVNEEGQVLSFKRNRMRYLKASVNQKGDLVVGIYIDGKLKQKRVSHLVAQAFLPNPDNKPLVKHLDGDKFNNRVENLQWCTPAEESINAKLTDEQIIFVRDNHEKFTQKQLAKIFGVDYATINRIQMRETCKFKGGLERESKRKPVPEEIRAEIKRLYVKGLPGFGARGLAKKFGIGQTTVRRILGLEL